jgi:hypothetical protein
MLTCLGVLIHIRMDFKTNPDIFLLWVNYSSDSFGRGDGAISTKQSNSSRTPKLFNAEPKDWL